jgi:V/A-type H+/Na+-transporting ATPase subunit E
MKTLEKDKDKIQKISDQLRHEILEPSQIESANIIEEAKKKAAQIIADAEQQAQKLILAGRQQLEQESSVFQSSLQQAAKQSLDALRQSIEHALFNDQLSKILSEATLNPKVIAELISAIVKSIDRDGISGNLSAAIPKAVSVKEVNDLLADGILKRLQAHSVEVGDLTGGAAVKFVDKKLTIDISEETLKDLLSRYVRKDFRKLIFGKAV